MAKFEPKLKYYIDVAGRMVSAVKVKVMNGFDEFPPSFPYNGGRAEVLLHPIGTFSSIPITSGIADAECEYEGGVYEMGG